MHNRVELTRYAIRRSGDFAERTSAVKAEPGQRGTQGSVSGEPITSRSRFARFAGQVLSGVAIQQRLSGVDVCIER